MGGLYLDEHQKTAKENNGFFRTAQVENLCINGAMIKKYLDWGYLKQVRKGLYTLTDDLANEYTLVQA